VTRRGFALFKVALIALTRDPHCDSLRTEYWHSGDELGGCEARPYIRARASLPHASSQSRSQQKSSLTKPAEGALRSGFGFRLQPSEKRNRRLARMVSVGTHLARRQRAVMADLEQVGFGRAAAPDENIRIVVARDFKHDVIRRRSHLRQLRTLKINECLTGTRWRRGPGTLP
jgi:hypothetical protein